MRDVKTGRIYFTKATREELGPAFVKAGYDIRQIRTLEQALRAWLATFSDKAAQEFLRVVEERPFNIWRKRQTPDAHTL